MESITAPDIPIYNERPLRHTNASFSRQTIIKPDAYWWICLRLYIGIIHIDKDPFSMKPVQSYTIQANDYNDKAPCSSKAHTSTTFVWLQAIKYKLYDPSRLALKKNPDVFPYATQAIQSMRSALIAMYMVLMPMHSVFKQCKNAVSHVHLIHLNWGGPFFTCNKKKFWYINVFAITGASVL